MSDFGIRPRRPTRGNEPAAEIAGIFSRESVPYISLLRESSAFLHYGEANDICTMQWLVNGLHVGTLEIDKVQHNASSIKDYLRSSADSVGDREWMSNLEKLTIRHPVWLADMYEYGRTNPAVQTLIPKMHQNGRYRIFYGSHINFKCYMREIEYGQFEYVGTPPFGVTKYGYDDLFLHLPMMENRIIPYFWGHSDLKAFTYTNAAVYMKYIEMLKRCKKYDTAHKKFNVLMYALFDVIAPHDRPRHEFKDRFIKYLREGSINIKITIESDRLIDEIEEVEDKDLTILLENIPANRNNLVFLKVHIAGTEWIASCPVEYLWDQSRVYIHRFLATEIPAERRLIKVTPRVRYDATDPILSKPCDPAHLKNLATIFMGPDRD